MVHVNDPDTIWIMFLEGKEDKGREGRVGEEREDWCIFLLKPFNIGRVCFLKIVKEFSLLIPLPPNPLPSPICIQMTEIRSLHFFTVEKITHVSHIKQLERG